MTDHDHLDVQKEVSFEDDTDLESFGRKREFTERLILLLRILSMQHWTRKEIFDTLGTHYKVEGDDEAAYARSRQLADRKFERDLEYLDEIGFAVSTLPDDHDRRISHYHIEGGLPLPLFVSNDDLSAFVYLYHFFEHATRSLTIPSNESSPSLPHYPYGKEILSLVRRLVAALPQTHQSLFAQLTCTPAIDALPAVDYAPHRNTIHTLIQAITADNAVSFLYYPSYRHTIPVPHERVDPHRIAFIDGHFYLIGFDHRSSKFHEYRIDRIQKESLLPHSSEKIDHNKLQNLFEFRYWADEDLVLSGSQRWISQTIERTEEPSPDSASRKRRCLIRATASSEWRALQQLHKYAQKVELIEPATSRARMCKEIEQMYQLYQK